MPTISLRLPEKLIVSIDELASVLHLHRTDYIKKALEKMNQDVLRLQRQERLKKASLIVRAESQIINAELEAIAYDAEN